MKYNDKQFDGEKKMSEKLDNFEMAVSDSGLKAFEKMLDNDTKDRSKRTFWWIPLMILGLGFVSYFLFSELHSNDTILQSSYIEKVEKVGNGSLNIVDLQDQAPPSRNDKSTLLEEQDIAKDTNFRNNRKEQLSRSFTQNSNEKGSAKITKGEEMFLIERYQERNATIGSNKVNIDTENILPSSKNNNNKFTSGVIEEDKNYYGKLTFIPSLINPLVYDWGIVKIDEEMALISPPTIDKSMISFGFHYSLGVSPVSSLKEGIGEFTNRAESGSYISFGLLGQYPIRRNSFLRTSFSYQKEEYAANVDGLRFPNMIMTDIDMNLVSHDVQFELGYGRTLFSKKGFSLNPLLSVFYNYHISSESNNQYTNPTVGEIVANSNSYKASNFGLSLGLLVEKDLKNFGALGVEPYLRFHPRTIGYDESTIVAPRVDYKIQYGLKLLYRL